MKKSKKLAEKPVSSETNNEVDSLEEYVLEAEQVELLKKYNGYLILERDLNQYKNELGSRLPYLDTRSKEFAEARVLYIAADKITKMFEDYKENRKQALELLERLKNTKENIPLDIDNG